MNRKFSSTLIPLLLTAVTPLCADAMGSKAAKPSKPNMQPVQPTTQVTPQANPMVTHWADPFITADFIWWKAQEDGLDFSYDGVAATNSVNASKGHVHHPKTKYEPGFKVGFGLKFKHDGWDLYGNYTWFRTSFDETKKSTSTPSGSIVNSGYYVMDAGTPVSITPSQTNGKWSLDFNVLDVEMGRNFWISQWLTLRPHFGMKFSWNEQKFIVNYLDIQDDDFSGEGIRLTDKNNQFGVGIRAGLDTAWYFAQKWCLFGEFAATGLWNDFDVSNKQTLNTGSASFVNMNTHEENFSVTGVLELALGLRFETAFSNDNYLFMLQAGWEQQIWFDQNRFFSPLTSQSPENLTLEGLTVKAGFDF